MFVVTSPRRGSVATCTCVGKAEGEMADPGVTSEASYLCYQRKRLELGRGHGMCLLDTMTQMREQLTWEERVAH